MSWRVPSRTALTIIWITVSKLEKNHRKSFRAVIIRSESDFLTMIQVDTILYRAATDMRAVKKNVRNSDEKS